MIFRILLLAPAILMGAACGEPAGGPAGSAGAGFKLIAHRGGIVGEEYAENSPGSLKAAIVRGYYMVEVDIRESADGHIVLQHNPDFQAFYGNPGQLAEMSWDEISQLRATPGNSRPIEFAELAKLCEGRMELMLDVKPPEHSLEFFGAIEEAMREHGLLENAFVIGTEQSREWFRGKARVGVDFPTLTAAAAAGEDVAALYFLFEHGRDLDASQVRTAQAMGVAVVPSINIFHYDDLPDHMAAAENDVLRMISLDVKYFQIDSPYDRWLGGGG